MTQAKIYTIQRDGENLSGTAEDIAREYCKHKGIRLCIAPMEENGGLYLLADFSHSGNLQPVTRLEDYNIDFETGYRLFFSEYLYSHE